MPHPAHVIDDLCKGKATLVRASRRSVRMLEDALHALRADRTAVTDEYIERVITDLRSALEVAT
jgi:hypothetical protein